MKPENLLYAKTHEWVHVETEASGRKIATVGISAFALELLTDLVFIELPEPGRRVTAGEPFGVVESVKAVSDLYSPVDGEVVEVNTTVVNQLDALSEDPFGDGWLVKIEVSDESGLENLLGYAAYGKQCAESE